jgi:hypothetical protein
MSFFVIENRAAPLIFAVGTAYAIITQMPAEVFKSAVQTTAETNVEGL